MTTTIIWQAAASSLLFSSAVPAYTCDHVNTRPEFLFGDLVFSQGENEADSLQPDSKSVEALSFLADLVDEHKLHEQMREARAWIADEFYPEQATLASLRLMKGLTQAELATIVGIPQSSIARIESGKENISLERAKKIATSLDVSLDDYHSALEATRMSKSV